MIKIFDTTLRDGEQSPGFTMNIPSKLMLARQLESLGVDVIEAGFPIASPDDAEAVRRIGEECERAEVCGLARCVDKDIETAIRSLETARKPRVHVFIATSDIHLEHKLKITRSQAVEQAVRGIELARSFTENIEFSPEDATRSGWDFLVEILNAAVGAGAKVLNIPDTVGYITPVEFGKMIAYIRANLVNADDVTISTHCHNDLGLAVANSLAGIENGARQVECTINGIGERAGNASLEEIVMALKTRREHFGHETGIVSSQLVQTSKLLSTITGKFVQVNKAIVGENAFAHEAGIHQHGVLSNRLTYEIMRPEDVGLSQSQLVLGKHSGRAALAERLKSLGIELDKEELKKVFDRFKQLADRKHNIYDEDLILLASEREMTTGYQLLDARVISEQDHLAIAYAKISIGEDVVEKTACGDGPVAALYSCIAQAIKLPGRMTYFHVSALTPDRDAVGVVSIKREEEDGTVWSGNGSDTDITIASGKALIDLLNRREVRLQHESTRHHAAGM